MSKIDDVARGLLIDAFITFVAVGQEKGYDSMTLLDVWDEALTFAHDREDEPGRDGVYDEEIGPMIDERRGLIRDIMREELADLEAASPSAEDTEGIRDGEQG